MKNKFKKFLKENGVYELYVENILKDHHAILEGIVERHAPSRWIQAAFDWAETTQKQDFWLKIDKEWQQLIKEERQ